MTKRDILSVGLKIVGVILLIYAVRGIPQVVSTVMFYLTGNFPGLENPGVYAWITVGSLILNIVLAGVLVGFADGIARRLVREDREMSIPSVDERPLFGLALRVIGIVLVVQAIPDLLQLFAAPALQAKHVEGTLGWQSYEEFWTKAWVGVWAEMIRAAASLILGVYLVTGARSLVDLLYPEKPPAAELDENG